MRNGAGITFSLSHRFAIEFGLKLRAIERAFELGHDDGGERIAEGW